MGKIQPCHKKYPFIYCGRKAFSLFNAYSFDVEPDLQGRVIIPSELRKRAGIEKQAVVIGASNHAEIWEPSKWDETQQNITNDDIRELLEQINYI